MTSLEYDLTALIQRLQAQRLDHALVAKSATYGPTPRIVSGTLLGFIDQQIKELERIRGEYCG